MTTKFQIQDQKHRHIDVEIQKDRVTFTPMFEFADGGYISYICDNFNMYYAPDVAKTVDSIWFQCARSSHELHLHLANILSKARETVLAWDIRDENDKRDQKIVLDICAHRGI